MNATNKSGFTIIETMLFLAVTGVLVVAILVGAGSSINIQRYRDSVSSFKSLIQQQYSDVSSARNDNTAGFSCGSDGIVGPGVQTRGQTDCVIMGRYVAINDTFITTSTVIGNKSAPTGSMTDIDELKSYTLALLPTSTETSELEWGARIAWPRSGAGATSPTTPRTVSLLIVRSPTSGLMYTFASNSDNSTATGLNSMMVAGNATPGQAQQRICVDSNGGFGGGMAVVVGAKASNAGSVESRSNDMGDGSTC